MLTRSVTKIVLAGVLARFPVAGLCRQETGNAHAYALRQPAIAMHRRLRQIELVSRLRL